MNKYYYVAEDTGDLAGPFSRYEAIVYLAKAVRYFFDKVPCPGFDIPGVRNIYDRCTFGVVGMGLPPVFKIGDNLGILHGFENWPNDIRVQYFPVVIPSPSDSTKGFIFSKPQEYIRYCYPPDVEMVNRVPFVHETWLRWGKSNAGDAIMSISYADTQSDII